MFVWVFDEMNTVPGDRMKHFEFYIKAMTDYYQGFVTLQILYNLILLIVNQMYSASFC